MKKLRKFWDNNRRLIILAGLSILTLVNLMFYKLGSLTPGGLSFAEQQASNTTYGWHGLYSDPMYLPIDLIRSVVNMLVGHQSQFTTRLPSVIIGMTTIIIFGWLIRLWHGTRTAILSTLMFATAAWVLHASRLASFDVAYLLVIPALLLTIASLQRHSTKPLVFYGSALIWGLLLYIPGAIWLVGLSIYWQRKAIKIGWNHFNKFRERFYYFISCTIWLPLLGMNLINDGQFKLWLGLPNNLSSPVDLLHNFGNIFYHLLLHGPQDASIWLSNSPILDSLTLILFALGVYFYATHWRVGRARILLSYFVIGAILISLAGPVSLSLIVPLLYICAATGVAYLIHDWLQIFPFNPLARVIGISLVVLVISLSCVYNLRAYFIAWPHNSLTQSTFHYHP